MKPKTIKTLYWIFTAIFCLAMFMDGIGGVTMQQAGKNSLGKLGYPMYLLVIMGWAKFAGVLAILQTRYQVIKEWAYAGFTISFTGAFLSWLAVGAGTGMLLPPLVMMALMFGTYFLWKKHEQVKAAADIEGLSALNIQLAK